MRNPDVHLYTTWRTLRTLKYSGIFTLFISQVFECGCSLRIYTHNSVIFSEASLIDHFYYYFLELKNIWTP